MHRELTELESLQSAYSDMHKDAYGFRPRSDSDEDWNSVEFLRARCEELVPVIDRVMAEEAEAKAAAIVRVEARIAGLMALGATDRLTACRWLYDAEDAASGGWDYLCYLLGLPYHYFDAEAAVRDERHCGYWGEEDLAA